MTTHSLPMATQQQMSTHSLPMMTPPHHTPVATPTQMVTMTTRSLPMTSPPAFNMNRACSVNGNSTTMHGVHNTPSHASSGGGGEEECVMAFQHIDQVSIEAIKNTGQMQQGGLLGLNQSYCTQVGPANRVIGSSY